MCFCCSPAPEAHQRVSGDGNEAHRSEWAQIFHRSQSPLGERMIVDIINQRNKRCETMLTRRAHESHRLVVIATSDEAANVNHRTGLDRVDRFRRLPRVSSVMGVTKKVRKLGIA